MTDPVPLLLLFCGLAGILLSRALLGRWFNHLALYSLIWGVGMAAYSLRLISYKPMSTEVWLIIAYGWAAFAAGACVIPLGRVALGVPEVASEAAVQPGVAPLERKLLVGAILLLSAIGLVGALQHWSVLISRFGSVAMVIVRGNLIYRMRVSDELPGMIPYVDSFALAAVFLAGVYSARSGRIRPIALLPLLVIIVGDIALVGRAKMLNGIVLFLSAYFLGRLAPGSARVPVPVARWKRVVGLVLVLALFLAAAEFVRGFRGTFERFYGASRRLTKLERNFIITPSLYMYISSHPAVLNAYWKAGGEHPYPGSNTFAPVFRMLARFGLADDVPDYQKFYPIPFPSNTATYLRELHADFGLAGVLVGPYLLGLLCTVFWFKAKRQPKLTTLAWLGHLYVVVAFSYLYQATRAGYWVISLGLSLLAGMVIHQWCHHASRRLMEAHA
jgi:oligosaccharide repeat unit polymerase